MNTRLICATVFHAIFSTFGDIEMSVLNLMNVPLLGFFNASIHDHYKINTTETEFNLIYSSIASTMQIGLMVGGLTMGFMMDFYGRKQTALYIRTGLGLVSALCMVLSRFFESIELFVFGHFLTGVIGAYKTVLIIYVAECAPDKLRGLATLTIAAGSSVMLLAIQPLCLPNVIGSSEHWHLLPALCFFIGLVHLAIGSMFPQSPKHMYITENRQEDAMAAIRFYHGDDANVAEIEAEYEREKDILSAGHITIQQVWANPTLRWSLFICLGVSLVPALSAVNIKGQYQIEMYIRYGMTQSEAVMTNLTVALVTLPLCFLAPIIIEKLGRRPVCLLVASLCALELFLFMIGQMLVDRQAHLNSLTAFFATAANSVGQVALMMGLLYMTPLMLSELCPHVARAPISMVVQVVPIFICIISVFLYPVVVAEYGALFFLPLIFGSLLLILLIYLHLPETSGLPIDAIIHRLDRTTHHRSPSVGALLHNTILTGQYGSFSSTISAGEIPATHERNFSGVVEDDGDDQVPLIHPVDPVH